MSTSKLLVGIALGLVIVSFFKPAWPLLSVAVLLICVDLLVSGK